MAKFTVANGKYTVYASNQQEAKEVLIHELERFDDIKDKMAELLTQDGQEWQKFMDNISEDRLNVHFNDEQSAIYDRDFSAKGEVRQRGTQEGDFLYELAYRYSEIQGHNADFRLAHEMGHLMLNPSNANQQKYDEKSNSRQVAGLIRRDEQTGKFYGEQIQENAINLIAQLAIRGNIKADDIVAGEVDLSEFNSYKKCDDLVNLLAVSMRNDFDKEMSFEQLTENKIDAVITRDDGSKVPANTFFYGILNDSSIIENEFDKYLGDGAWRDLNQAFDKLYEQNISKEKFDLIFENAQGLIQEFANVRYQDKYKEAVTRNGGFNNIPNLTKKIEMIEKMTGKQLNRNESSVNQQEETNMPEGYSINEYGEIIRPIRNDNNRNVESTNIENNNDIRNTRFGAVINSSRYDEQLNSNENKLSLKQRVAHFLQKNNLFMNLSFVEKFVHNQLDILPESTIQMRNESRPVNSARQNFINELTRGVNRNLPPIQRMSDPQKLEEIRRKMEQNQQNNDMER